MAFDPAMKLKVLCPIEGKDKKTYWKALGAAFRNDDDTINVYLDSLPINGKLYLRKWEDERFNKNEAPKAAADPSLPF